MWQSWLAFSVGFLALIGTIIWYAVHNKTIQKVDIMPNADIIINLCKTKFTQGYYMGYVTRDGKDENKNDTFLVRYYPIDVNQGENVPRPDIQEVVVLKDNLIPVIMSRRKVWLIVSENPDDYPELMRESVLGEFAKIGGMKAYLKKTFGDAFREMTKVVADLQVEWAGGEVTAHELGKMKETKKKLQEISTLLNDANKKLGENE